MLSTNPTIELPNQVMQELTRRYREPPSLTRLSTMSRNLLWLAQFSSTKVVVKSSDNRVEADFFHITATELRGLGVQIPELIFSTTVEGRSWLVIEWVESRWPGDAALPIMAALHRVRNVPCGETYRPVWTEHMDKAAQRALGLPDSWTERISIIRKMSSFIFEPVSPCSGDPNPTNWGVRSDGAVVLYDWERFCFAHPAVDLSILVPGLGDITSYERIAQRYLLACDASFRVASSDELTRSIALTKIWTVVELLWNWSEGRAPGLGNAQFLRDSAVSWIDAIIDAVA
jgi:hypothetical protein